MKNYLLLFFLTITLSVGAQQLVFDITEFAVEPNSQDQIGELFDEFYTDKKFKSGGVVLERLEHGSREGRTHRYVRMWELGKWGMEEDVDKYEERAFWSRLRNFVDTSVKSERYSGRILSWKEGDTTKTPYVHIWDIKPSDPVAFKKAHDKLVEDAAEALGINTLKCKIYAIMIMGAMGGAAGTFYAQKYLYLDPPIAYSIHLSVEMLLVTIVGGMGTIFGPLVGAFVLHTVNEIARHFIDTPGLSLIVYGLILIVIIGYLPNGLIGAFKKKEKKSDSTSLDKKTSREDP